MQHDLPIFNRLKDPMELSEAQVSDYMSRPSKGLAEGFSFPEDLLPSCTRVNSSVPLMTMINSVLNTVPLWRMLHPAEEVMGVLSRYPWS